MQCIVTIGMLDCLWLFSDFSENLYYSLQVTMSSIIIYNDMNCVYNMVSHGKVTQTLGSYFYFPAN